MLKYNNVYNILGNSPWAMLIPFNVLGIITFYINGVWAEEHISSLWVFIQILFLLISILSWLWEVTQERYHHNTILNSNLKLGFILFVMSEVALFFTLFIGYGYLIWISDYGLINRLPEGIHKLNAFSIPLLNTFILYLSGMSVTLSMLKLTYSKWSLSIKYLVITIILGILFTSFQIYEYYYSGFNITDSYYGSIFYMITGFHGIHVIVGTIFLIYSLCKIINKEWYSNNTIMYSNSILYWHFVDYVWLVVFTLLYI